MGNLCPVHLRLQVISAFMLPRYKSSNLNPNTKPNPNRAVIGGTN